MDKQTYNYLYSKNKENRPKRKAFIGALIGTGVSLASSLIGGAIQRRKEAALRRENQIAQNKQAAYSMADNLTNQYANQEYVDEMNKRIEFAAGGELNKANYRFRRPKQYGFGGEDSSNHNNNNEANASNIINSIGNGISSIVNATMSNPQNAIKTENVALTPAKTNIVPNSYVSLPEYYNRLRAFRLGGRANK